SVSGLALDPGIAAMALGNTLNQGKTNAGPLVFAKVGQAAEKAEDLTGMARVESNAIVGDVKNGGRFVLPHANLDFKGPIRRRELKGIVEQFVDSGGQKLGIGGQRLEIGGPQGRRAAVVPGTDPG